MQTTTNIEGPALAAPMLRKLTNPPVRRELRADFPGTLNNWGAADVLKTIEAELGKHGTSLGRVGRITVAYPHKHPEIFPMHFNAAKGSAENLVGCLKTQAPQVRWILADGICEAIHLGRSENQTSLHALLRPQIYELHEASQKTPLPFLDPANKETEFFIVADSGLEQGTTLANMISYIEHNGGKVLAASTDAPTMHLAQTDFSISPHKPVLSGKFNAAARNNKSLPAIARAFSESAKRSGHDWSPEECLEMFEQRLNTHGNTLFALTNSECMRLMITVRDCANPSESFPALLKMADSVSAAPRL